MKIFIGSSSECRGDVRKIEGWIKKAGHTPIPWDKSSAFALGSYTLESIFDLSRTINGAILVFGEDDQVTHRGTNQSQPRDNLLVEYGLFAAVLGRENTIIYRSGSPRIASDLAGIIYADPADESQAEEKIITWLKNLKATSENQILAQIRQTLLTSEEQITRPFLSWLCKQHLTKTLRALEPVRRQTQGEGVLSYTKEILKHLAPDRLDTVLALCGRKFALDSDSERYFAKFYEFARERQQRAPHHEDGISVCRIFVEDEKEKQLTSGMANELERHVKNRQYGVLGLTLQAKRRSDLDKFVGQGFAKCLDEGFGFLLFFDSLGTATAIIHEGMDTDLAFVKLKDELNLCRILDIYKMLCLESAQYKEEENVLKALFKRLQIPIVS